MTTITSRSPRLYSAAVSVRPRHPKCTRRQKAIMASTAIHAVRVASSQRCGLRTARISLARNIWRTAVRSILRNSACRTNSLQAAPFHAKGDPPRAPCPKCLHDKGDDTPRELYSIRGLCEGEYDSTIPPEWMESPPMKLDSSIPGMDAVRVRILPQITSSCF